MRKILLALVLFIFLITTNSNAMILQGIMNLGKNGSGGGGGPNTCGSNCWTITRDFSSGTVGSIAQGFDAFDYSTSDITYSSDLSTRNAKVLWTTTNDPTGSINLPSPQLTNGNEFWWAADLYFQTPWNWLCSPVIKIMRLHVMTNTGTHIGYLSIFSDASGYITLSNEITSGGYQPESSVSFGTNQWVRMQFYVKLSPTAPIFRIWRNGVLVFNDTTHNTLTSTTDVADFTYFMSYWNGGSPQSQTEYVKNIVMTNQTPANVDTNGYPLLP
jgi:hypothetical protein